MLLLKLLHIQNFINKGVWRRCFRLACSLFLAAPLFLFLHINNCTIEQNCSRHLREGLLEWSARKKLVNWLCNMVTTIISRFFCNIQIFLSTKTDSTVPLIILYTVCNQQGTLAVIMEQSHSVPNIYWRPKSLWRICWGVKGLLDPKLLDYLGMVCQWNIHCCTQFYKMAAPIHNEYEKHAEKQSYSLHFPQERKSVHRELTRKSSGQIVEHMACIQSLVTLWKKIHATLPCAEKKITLNTVPNTAHRANDKAACCKGWQQSQLLWCRNTSLMSSITGCQYRHQVH